MNKELVVRKLENVIYNINDICDDIRDFEYMCSEALKINDSIEYKKNVSNLTYSLEKQKQELRRIKNKILN